MTYTLIWLPQVLEEAGLKVAEVKGWETRGRGAMGNVRGVMCHHTNGNARGNMPSLSALIAGRPNLLGPLSQLGLGRDGTFYVIAAGRSNHAGEGCWEGVNNMGNWNFIGVEAENTGYSSDPWPEVQMDAYQRGVAAMLKHMGQSVDWCIGHKEYAPGRKPDPSFDMSAFRSYVTRILAGEPQPPLIPAFEPVAPATGAPRATLRRGAQGDLVKRVQCRVGVAVDGDFGPETEAAVRRFQGAHGMVPDGIVGPKTWAELDAVPA